MELCELYGLLTKTKRSKQKAKQCELFFGLLLMHAHTFRCTNERCDGCGFCTNVGASYSITAKVIIIIVEIPTILFGDVQHWENITKFKQNAKGNLTVTLSSMCIVAAPFNSHCAMLCCAVLYMYNVRSFHVFSSNIFHLSKLKSESRCEPSPNSNRNQCEMCWYRGSRFQKSSPLYIKMLSQKLKIKISMISSWWKCVRIRNGTVTRVCAGQKVISLFSNYVLHIVDSNNNIDCCSYTFTLMNRFTSKKN